MTVLLLAAGSAQRFGSQKLLARLADGRMVVEAAVQNLRASGEDIVAIASGDELVVSVLERCGCRVVINARAHEGMGTSIAAGVRASDYAAHWLIALGDMPFIQPETIVKVAASLAGQHRIVVPQFDRKRGHPVGFSASLKSELMALEGDSGARSVIAAHAHEVLILDVNDGGILADIDTQSDLQAESQRAGTTPANTLIK